MSRVTLRFVGGPYDGQRIELSAGTRDLRVPIREPFRFTGLDAPLDSRPPREGRYERARLYEDQHFRGGVQNNPRRFIVEEDVMRWMGE